MKSGEARMLNRMMQQEAGLSLTSGGILDGALPERKSITTQVIAGEI